MNIKLRNYQQDIINQVISSMQRGNRKPLVVSPTGSGKTVLFAWFAEKSQNKGSTVWFLVHRKELYDQTVETFERFHIGLNTIHIGMVGQVSRNLSKFPKPDLIVFDEAHHASARTWQRIIEAYPDTWIIGLTATPCRLDGKALGDTFDDLIEGLGTRELIELGFLSDYKLIAADLARFDKIKTKYGEYDLKAAESILSGSKIYGDVIDTYQKFAAGKQAIYFCTTIEHSEHTADAFNQAGIKAVHFDGNTPKKKRKEIIKQFRNGDIQILTNCELIGEGFDMPACDCVGMLRPTQSLTIYLQQAGRALRPREGKTAVIIDHVGNNVRHGFPCEQREWSLEGKIKTGREIASNGEYVVRQCEECYAVFSNKERLCPNCGAEYVPNKKELEQIREVEMKELERRDLNKRTAWAWTKKAVKNAKTYEELCEIGKLRGYKHGWAYHTAKALGIWR